MSTSQELAELTVEIAGLKAKAEVLELYDVMDELGMAYQYMLDRTSRAREEEKTVLPGGVEAGIEGK